MVLQLSCIYCEDTTTEVCFKDATVKVSSNGLDFSYRLLYDETITIDLNDIKEKMEADLNKVTKKRFFFQINVLFTLCSKYRNNLFLIILKVSLNYKIKSPFFNDQLFSVTKIQ